MNERIKELVGQAKFMAEETINKQISSNAELNAFAEKFAELLIEKVCYDIMDVHGASPEHIALVARHYGVEL